MAREARPWQQCEVLGALLLFVGQEGLLCVRSVHILPFILDRGLGLVVPLFQSSVALAAPLGLSAPGFVLKSAWRPVPLMRFPPVLGSLYPAVTTRASPF